MVNKERIESFIKEIKKVGYSIQENISLKQYTSLQIGGPARLLSEPKTIQELQFLIKVAKKNSIQYQVLGNGTNTLVLDEGYNGLIIITKTNFNNYYVNDTSIVVQAGASLKDVCLYALDNHLSGLEFAYGIPGSVGGAVFMNAGAYGGEMKDVVASCVYLDENNEIHTVAKKDLDFSYRHSIFSEKNYTVLEVTYELTQGNYDTIKQRMDALLAKRIAKQPLEYPSAGSTFKRPEGAYASALIEQAGLKGFVHKNAMVSDKHAGFLINHNGASSEAFLELIQIVKREVKRQSGYDLECEVKIIK